MYITGIHSVLDTADAIRIVVDERFSFPCRRCLTDAEVGEAVLLVSHDPWRLASPYRQSGPVFVHERDCPVHTGVVLPEQQKRRFLSLRGFDSQGLSTVAEVVDGVSAERRIEDVLRDGRTDFLHLHNAGPGCFAARVDR